MIIVYFMFLSLLFLGVVFYAAYSEGHLEKIFNKELETAKRNAQKRKEQK